VIGTLGLLLAGERRGFLPEVRPAVEALIAAGFHVAPELVERVLNDVDEAL
jgi:predicted nucleic acid-binding protein